MEDPVFEIDPLEDDLPPRRLQGLAPEGVEMLRGLKVRPEPGDTPESLAKAQHMFDRLLDIIEADGRTHFDEDKD